MFHKIFICALLGIGPFSHYGSMQITQGLSLQPDTALLCYDSIPGGGTIEASKNAPGDKSSVTLTGPSGSGTITVTSVYVDGELKKRNVDYTVDPETGPSKNPKVIFSTPPPKDKPVKVYGTTSQGDTTHKGTLAFS